MNYDTAGNLIKEILMCDCGLTGGCQKCNPNFIGYISNKEARQMKAEIKRFKTRFDKDFVERQKVLNDIVWRIAELNGFNFRERGRD